MEACALGDEHRVDLHTSYLKSAAYDAHIFSPLTTIGEWELPVIAIVSDDRIIQQPVLKTIANNLNANMMLRSLSNSAVWGLLRKNVPFG